MPVKINSSGGGSVTLSSGSIATDVTATFPANTGTVVTTGSTGAVTAAMLASSALAQVAHSSIGTQVSITNTNAMPADDTPPLSTEGLEVLSVTITPRSTSSKIIVLSNVPLIQSTAGTLSGHTAAIFRGSTLLSVRGVLTGNVYNANLYSEHTFVAVDTPSTASPVTYSLRVGPGTGQNQVDVNPAALYADSWGTHLVALEVLV